MDLRRSYLVPLRRSLDYSLFLALRFYLQKGGCDMDNIDSLLSILDTMLDTKRKRHITGGILLSVSMLFGGLAVTVMTIKNEEKNDE